MKHATPTPRVKIVVILVIALAAVLALGDWETGPSRTPVGSQPSMFVLSEGAVADGQGAPVPAAPAQQHARASIDH